MTAPLQILEPWIPLHGSTAKAWEAGFAREVTKGHPLYGVPVKALAYERVWGIYQLLQHDCQYVVVERAFSPRTTLPDFVLYRDAHHLMTDVISMHHAEWREETLGFIRERGHFSVKLTPHNYGPREALPAHGRVLRPLLRVAEEFWVYGVSMDSPLCTASSPILVPHRAKHRIRTDVDAVSGYELLWNARGGQRGSVVFLVGIESLIAAGVFQHCSRPNIVGNMGAGHTPSAVRFAKESVREGKVVAALLSRNNGIEWMDVLAEPAMAIGLFEHVYKHNDGRQWNEYD